MNQEHLSSFELGFLNSLSRQNSLRSLSPVLKPNSFVTAIYQAFKDKNLLCKASKTSFLKHK